MPVNLQDTPTAGPLRAIDLERDVNTGRIYHLQRAAIRQCPPCTGDCRQGRDCTAPDTVPTDAGWLDSCAPEGGKPAEPVPSVTTRRDVIGARVGVVVLLTSATTVVGVIVAAIYARWPMAWPLG